MKSAVFAVAAIALLATAALAPAKSFAQESNPESVVRGMLAAFDDGDINQVASYFSDDATASAPGFCRPSGVCNSKAEILAATSAEIAERVRSEILSLSVNGDTVNVRISEAAPAFSEFGIERVLIDLVFTVTNGKITHFDDQLDRSDPQTAKFVAALEATAEQPTQAPATGDGSSARGGTSHEWLVLVLVAAGVGSVVAGGAARRRRTT
jgi:limonene-1,2-epoxide hydrolase